MTRVWTKQHKAVLEQLRKNGRYVALRKFIQNDLDEQAEMMAFVYDELVRNHPNLEQKPKDAEVPVWVSFALEATMQPTPDFMILELEIKKSKITEINVAKWGQMLNYGYIPKDEKDKLRHRELMSRYGVDDAKAVMTQFYPELKMEIMQSWKRLFDPDVKIGNNSCYGLVWELKKSELVRVIS